LSVVFFSPLTLSKFDDTEGEWTEVPSRKKPKAKREMPELQDNTTRNERIDQLQEVIIITVVVAVS